MKKKRMNMHRLRKREGSEGGRMTDREGMERKRGRREDKEAVRLSEEVSRL